jgi:hypothetical protein
MTLQRFTLPRLRRDAAKAGPPAARKRSALTLLRRWLLRHCRLPRAVV